MITPKINYYQSITLILIMAVSALFTGCTLDGISTDSSNTSENVTQEDLEAAARIMGETLSDENEGVMSSLNDALTTFTTDGFTLSESGGSDGLLVPYTHDDDENTGRGKETNFSYSYDPDTGQHTIAFQRIVHNGEFYKSVTDTLKYIFTDVDGAFIAFPREQRLRIETIDFTAFRDGTVQDSARESFFTRRDTFFIDGVSEASAILSLDGVHRGNGELMATTENNDVIQRSYSAIVNFLDIQIDKAVVRENGSLEAGVNGVLSWEIEIVKSKNGNSETKTLSGTVEMNGDGTALLRFKKFAKIFLINLDDGDVKDHEKEFEGQVKHVNIQEETFTLVNGRVFQLNDHTVIDDSGDLLSLEAVAQKLEEGVEVWAEGEGHVEENVFIVEEVEFEYEEHNHDDIIVKEGTVTNVNLDAKIFEINNDLLVRVSGDTQFDDSGDYMSLEAVVDAMENGDTVVVRVEGIEDTTTDADLLALEVRFELNN